MEKKVALVSGGSSGIGLACAQALARRGCTVYALSRRACGAENLRHLSVDVRDEARVAQAVEEIVRREGRLDIVVCCAGFGISGAAEFTANEAARELLDVNLFGVVNCCKAALGPMRAQGAGRIVAVSSVAGPIAIPFQSWYSVSKAAVCAYVQALRLEAAPFGVTVCAMLPGDVKTGFTAARQKDETGDELYGGRIRRSVAVMEHDEENGMSAAFAGEAVARAALRRRVAPSYGIGLKYRFFLLLFKLLPARASSFLVGKLYGG